MGTKTHLQLVESYIEAYNRFDVLGMIENFSDEIHFQNIVDEQINLSLLGVGAFREQALQATELFSERNQRILEISEQEDSIEVTIEYTGILKIDLPNGVKEGETIQLQGKSIFEFHDNQIVSLKDIS